MKLVTTAFIAMWLTTSTAHASVDQRMSDSVPVEVETALRQAEAVRDAKESKLEPISTIPVTGPTPVKVVFVSENQPVHIVDAQGRLVQIIYLKKK